MKRLLLFALIAAAAWYGWKHHDELRSHGAHEIVVVNHSGRTLERIRIAVAGQEFAVETLAPDASKVLPMHSEQDGEFVLYWNVHGVDGERHWSGGGFTHGPVLMRHRLEFVDGNAVVWNSEEIAGKTPRAP
jgi:hypothetical protein